MNLLKAVVKAAFELGKTVLEFTRQMIEFTYRTAARLIDAALAVGAKVVDILEAVVTATYFVFRKMERRAAGVGTCRRHPWLAARSRRGAGVRALARGGTGDPLRQERGGRGSRLGAEQTQAMFERMVQLCEAVGSAVTEVIDWAVARGSDALDLLGGIWDRIGNSIIYALNYPGDRLHSGDRQVRQGR